MSDIDPKLLADELEQADPFLATNMLYLHKATVLAALRAYANAMPQHRYAVPFKMIGDKVEWVQVRFAPRDSIKDQPTEANPSPIRIIIVGDLERVQPHALASPQRYETKENP